MVNKGGGVDASPCKTSSPHPPMLYAEKVVGLPLANGGKPFSFLPDLVEVTEWPLELEICEANSLESSIQKTGNLSKQCDCGAGMLSQYIIMRQGEISI